MTRRARLIPINKDTVIAVKNRILLYDVIMRAAADVNTAGSSLNCESAYGDEAYPDNIDRPAIAKSRTFVKCHILKVGVLFVAKAHVPESITCSETCLHAIPGFVLRWRCEPSEIFRCIVHSILTPVEPEDIFVIPCHVVRLEWQRVSALAINAASGVLRIDFPAFDAHARIQRRAGLRFKGDPRIYSATAWKVHAGMIDA